MNNTIRYRAKDKDINEWVMIEKQITLKTSESTVVADISSDCSEMTYDVWCRSSNRYDKNGTEIFVGDVLQDPSDSFGKRYRVEWSNGVWVAGVTKPIVFHISECNTKQFEVIGNIYDNPNLLNK